MSFSNPGGNSNGSTSFPVDEAVARVRRGLGTDLSLSESSVEGAEVICSPFSAGNGGSGDTQVSSDSMGIGVSVDRKRLVDGTLFMGKTLRLNEHELETRHDEAGRTRPDRLMIVCDLRRKECERIQGNGMLGARYRRAQHSGILLQSLDVDEWTTNISH